MLFLLSGRCRRPSLPAVTVDPTVPYSAHLRPLSALTGAKQHCFRTCRELVKRRWVWNQEKGQRPKTLPCTSSRSHTLWHPGRAAGTLKQVVKPPPSKPSKSFLKCICLFLRLGWGVGVGSRTFCWGIWCDLISRNERHPPSVWGSFKKLIRCCCGAHLPAVEVKFYCSHHVSCCCCCRQPHRAPLHTTHALTHSTLYTFSCANVHTLGLHTPRALFSVQMHQRCTNIVHNVRKWHLHMTSHNTISFNKIFCYILGKWWFLICNTRIPLTELIHLYQSTF